jgi:hypothetical protein
MIQDIDPSFEPGRATLSFERPRQVLLPLISLARPYIASYGSQSRRRRRICHPELYNLYRHSFRAVDSLLSTRSRCTLYTHLAKAFIQRDKDFNIFQCLGVASNNKELPTWDPTGPSRVKFPSLSDTSSKASSVWYCRRSRFQSREVQAIF